MITGKREKDLERLKKGKKERYRYIWRMRNREKGKEYERKSEK